jgi:ELWxxDGT repeat protein
VNGTMFFSANDGAHGFELWQSNGSAAGTFLVQDINPGSSDSYPLGPTNVNGTLFFAADDGVHGFEPWILSPSSVSATTTAVASSPNPSLFSQVVTFTATISPASGVGTPTGTVHFTEGSTDLTPGGVSLTAGQATFTTVALTVGSHTITAFYSGDVNFQSSFGDDSASPQVVQKGDGTPTVTSSPDPSRLGQAVTFTATVTHGSVLPTGTVDFKEGSTDLTPGGVTLTNGQATFSTSSLAVGSDTITAIYSGDSNFASGQGDDSASPQVVNKDGTNGLLISVPGATVFGQPAAFFVFVTAADPAAGIPTGTVTLKEGTTVLGANITLSGGSGTFTTASLSVGSHTITAVYNGDSNFTGSQADDSASPLVVSKDGTTTALTSSQKTIVSGERVVFRATVRAGAPGTGTPTGTLDFKDGATDLTPGGVTLSAGEATFSTTALAVGSHTITAVYSGDADYTASQVNDAAAPLAVIKDASHTVLTAFPNPAVLGQVVTFTVIVRAVPLGSGTPTGTVTFLDGTKTLGSLTLDSTARATFSTASLSRGNHAINVNYSGDGKFLASSDTNFGEAVQQDATTTTVTASANPAVVGTTVTFTATLQANSPGGGIPTGTVTFLDITTTLGTGTLNASGKATFTTSALALGTHAISANYGGDNNFLASASATLAETIKSMTLGTAASGVVSTPLVKSPTIVDSPATAPLPRPLASTSVDNYFASGQGHRWSAVPMSAKLRRPTPETDWLG